VTLLFAVVNILAAPFFDMVSVIYCQKRFYLSLSVATLDSALSIFPSSLRHLLFLSIQLFCHFGAPAFLIGVPAMYCDNLYNRTTTCSLQRADHSSTGVLPTVVLHCMWSRNLDNEGTMANWGGGGCRARNEQTNHRLLPVFRYLHHIYIVSLYATVCVLYVTVGYCVLLYVTVCY